ncbi:MAG TPA: TatD family deoxyribonuclease [Gammaproteobacteria bacterium]|nr:TatD family deoxyribonuclease [Gammaproteobacteria bacterium]
MKLIDSHCHLDRVDLTPYAGNFQDFVRTTLKSGIKQMLCVSIDLESYPAMLELVREYDNIFVSVGVHPNDRDRREPTAAELVELAVHPKNVAIGETGLDYFRSEKNDGEWQQKRFRTHIQAAREASKPLIIHTRQARNDTITLMQQEQARDAGGVMHCFTESWEMAQQALDMGFYISFSGIVTFNNAADLRDVAKKIPLDRMLIETDSPYLAPAPYRGKPNQPKYLYRVAEIIAELRSMDVAELAQITSSNFFDLFTAAKHQ